MKKLLALVALAGTYITAPSPARAHDFYYESHVEFCRQWQRTYVCSSAQTWVSVSQTLLIGHIGVAAMFTGQGYIHGDESAGPVWAIIPATWRKWVKIFPGRFCAHSSWHDVSSVHTAIPSDISAGPPPPAQEVALYSRAFRPNCDCGNPEY